MPGIFTGSSINGLRVAGVLWLVLTNVSTTVVWADPPQQPARKARPSPMALIVVTTDYQNRDLPPLPHAADSAIRLATAFHQMGYDIRFLTGTESLEKVTRGTPLAKGAVREANDGKKLGEEIKDWMTDVARSQAPLAILTLSGHGEQREGVPYLLGRNDAPGEGGVSVTELRQAASTPLLSLVMVYDACRVEIPRKPGVNRVEGDGKKVETKPGTDQLPSSQQWENRNEVVRIVRDSVGGTLPTIVYSTRTGEVARDREDLISHLAKGLRYDEEVINVLSSAHPEFPSTPDLTLFYWLYYGMAGLLRSSRLKQTCVVEYGAVPLHAPIARLEKGRFKAPDQPFQSTNLLTTWEPQWGQFDSGFDPRSGYRVTNPAGGTRTVESYRAGKLQGDTGIEVGNDQVLTIDVVANYEGTGKAPPVFSMEVHAAHRSPVTTDRVPMCRMNHPYNFPYGGVFRIRVPVNPLPPGPRGKQLLNFLAFAAISRAPNFWPPSATLTVLNIKLESRPDGMLPAAGPSIQPWSPNLLSQWLPVNPAPDGSPLLRVTHDPKRGLAFRPDPANEVPVFSKAGGDLLFPEYVPKGSVLEIEAQNSSARQAELTLELVNIVEQGGKILGTPFLLTPVRLPPGLSKQKVSLPGDGFVHYLAVGTSEAITLKSLKVVPKQPSRR